MKRKNANEKKMDVPNLQKSQKTLHTLLRIKPIMNEVLVGCVKLKEQCMLLTSFKKNSFSECFFQYSKKSYFMILVNSKRSSFSTTHQEAQRQARERPHFSEKSVRRTKSNQTQKIKHQKIDKT